MKIKAILNIDNTEERPESFAVNIIDRISNNIELVDLAIWDMKLASYLFPQFDR
jgi:hypothetical protein